MPKSKKVIKPEKRLWFKNKSYGWGWVPVTWEGWLVLLFHIMIMVPVLQSLIELKARPHTTNEMSFAVFSYLSFIIVDMAVLILICLKTGEKPKWKWGN